MLSRADLWFPLQPYTCLNIVPVLVNVFVRMYHDDLSNDRARNDAFESAVKLDMETGGLQDTSREDSYQT